MLLPKLLEVAEWQCPTCTSFCTHCLISPWLMYHALFAHHGHCGHFCCSGSLGHLCICGRWSPGHTSSALFWALPALGKSLPPLYPPQLRKDACTQGSPALLQNRPALQLIASESYVLWLDNTYTKKGWFLAMLRTNPDQKRLAMIVWGRWFKARSKLISQILKFSNMRKWEVMEKVKKDWYQV